MKLLIRKINKSEFFQTENITREAFWNLYTSGCDEHLVLHQLRKSKSYIEELDKIAISDNKILGHIISTKASVIDIQNKTHDVLCVGPISVLPEFQNTGIGTTLLNDSISEADKLGFKGMILFGNPDYYHRFGFRNAKEFEIMTKDYQNFDPFMALELVKNGLRKIKGRFIEDEAFTTKEEELFDFEKMFPEKVKGKPKIILNH